MLPIIPGYLAGLSVGVYCLGTCLPVFLPVLLSQEQTPKTSFRLVIEFSLGRLVGYLTFGLIFGYLGQIITNTPTHQIVALANIWTGILMIVYSLGVIDKKFCSFLPFQKIKWPLLLGFLTGVNVCPPFLASLTHVFNLRDAISSLTYFLLFFLGTSTYIVPTALLGTFTRLGWLPKLARFSGIAVGIYFITQSIVETL